MAVHINILDIRQPGSKPSFQPSCHPLRFICRLIEKRFGPIPEWAETQLDNSSVAELKEKALRVLDAATLLTRC